MSVLRPSETLGAATTREDIAYRFHVDDLIEPILHDNVAQDAQFRAAVEQQKLDGWFDVVQLEAKKMLEEQTEANARDEAAESALRDELATLEETKVIDKGTIARVLGLVDDVNGYAGDDGNDGVESLGDDRSSTSAVADGDVEMN